MTDKPAASSPSEQRICLHPYLSTACLHGKHELCRRTCKFCEAPCQCRDCVHATFSGSYYLKEGYLYCSGCHRAPEYCGCAPSPLPSAPATPRYFIDTEFIESGSARPLELLSIGIVADDGREFYAVNDEADLLHANDWVKQNVLPHLGTPRLKLYQIASSVIGFVAHPKPEFWGYYADYDWVVLCQLFGAMVDLPSGWPMYCRDLKQLCDSLGNPKLPDQTSTEHNALNDARWNKQAYEFLVRQSAVPAPPSPAPIDRASWQAGVSAAIRQVANMKLFDVHGRYLADSIVRELQSLEPPL